VKENNAGATVSSHFSPVCKFYLLAFCANVEIHQTETRQKKKTKQLNKQKNPPKSYKGKKGCTVNQEALFQI